MKLIWTVDYMIEKLLGTKEDIQYLRNRFFKHKAYNGKSEYARFWELCKRVADGDEKAWKAWFKLTKNQKDYIIQCAETYEPFSDFLFDGHIIIG